MLGIRRVSDRRQLPEFEQHGPVLVEIEQATDEVRNLVDDYSAFGGTLRALLVARNQDRVDIEIDYASWHLFVARLPEPLSREIYRPLRKLERRGDVAVCFATIERVNERRNRAGGRVKLWLNPAA